jgi:hypothetical protein
MPVKPKFQKLFPKLSDSCLNSEQTGTLFISVWGQEEVWGAGGHFWPEAQIIDVTVRNLFNSLLPVVTISTHAWIQPPFWQGNWRGSLWDKFGRGWDCL